MDGTNDNQKIINPNSKLMSPPAIRSKSPLRVVVGTANGTGSSTSSTVPKPPLAPAYLPPKSPASSITSKFLGTNTPAKQSSKPKRRKSKSRRRRSKSPAPSAQQLSNQDQAIRDPCPDHLHAGSDPDDLSNSGDLSCVSFEDEGNVSPTSVTEALPSRPDSPSTRRLSKRDIHRRSRSWDSSIDGSSLREVGTAPSKSCLPGAGMFRRNKVMSSEGSSGGSGRDTLVPVEDLGRRISGRQMHESAKAALNAGKYDKALSMFEAIEKAQRERFGELHPSVGAAMHNVGVVRLRKGQAQDAEAILMRAVEIRRQVLGPDHLELASSLAKLGSARVLLQQFDDAIQDLRESLRITRKTVGRSHKTVAHTLCHMACLYFEAGELFAAEATFEDALEMYREVYPTETDRASCTAQIAETLCNIGSIQNRRKEFAKAIHSFDEAFNLQLGILGHDHPRVIATLDNLGYSYSKSKDYVSALTCYKKMAAAQNSKNNGVFTVESCVTLKKQNVINEKLKNLQGAIEDTARAYNALLHQQQSGLLSGNDPALVETGAMLYELQQKVKRKLKKST